MDKKLENHNGGTMNEDTTFRDWAQLPDLVLHSILNRFTYLVDFFAFSSICTTWRSVSMSLAGSHDYITSRSPFLLCPITHNLQTLNHASNYHSKLSPETLKNPCIGYSHGYLIFTGDTTTPHPLLADVFTGKEIRLPALPLGCNNVYYGVLTAPPSASCGCIVLLFFGWGSGFLSCRLGEEEYWSHHQTGIIGAKSRIKGVIAFKGKKLYAVSDRFKLFVLDLIPHPKLKPLVVEDSYLKSSYLNAASMCGQLGGYIRPQLVECDGELLVLLIFAFQAVKFVHAKIDAFRLDLSRLTWVKVESLGDFSLFIDYGWKSALCINPSRWGGRHNCIYLTGPGVGNTWSEFPFNGSVISIKKPPVSSNSEPDAVIYDWPSPICVFPSLFY